MFITKIAAFYVASVQESGNELCKRLRVIYKYLAKVSFSLFRFFSSDFIREISLTFLIFIKVCMETSYSE